MASLYNEANGMGDDAQVPPSPGGLNNGLAQGNAPPNMLFGLPKPKASG